MDDLTKVALVEIHEADKILFTHGAEDQGQQDRRERELILVHEPADHAEGYAHAHVEYVFVDGERAQQRYD